MRKVSIGRAARELGVPRATLRRWELAGEIEVERAPNGRRRYDLDSLSAVAMRAGASANGVTLAYARVEDSSQVDELASDVTLLESFCNMNRWVYRVLQDVGDGQSDDQENLQILVDQIRAGGVARLVITGTDRLPKSCGQLLLSLCEQSATEVVVINPNKGSKSAFRTTKVDVLSA